MYYHTNGDLIQTYTLRIHDMLYFSWCVRAFILQVILSPLFFLGVTTMHVVLVFFV